MQKLKRANSVRMAAAGSVLAAVLLVTACGGGGSGVTLGAVASPTPSATRTSTPAPTSGTLTVATVGGTTYDGSYGPTVTSLPSSGMATTEMLGDDYSNPHKPNIEFDVQIGTLGMAKSVYFWFTDAHGAMTFFGCGGSGAQACPSSIGYDPMMKQFNFNITGITLPQVVQPAAITDSTVTPTLVSGGASIKVSGYLQGP